MCWPPPVSSSGQLHWLLRSLAHTHTQYVEYDMHTLTHSPLSWVYYMHASSTPLFHTSFQILLLSSTLFVLVSAQLCISCLSLSQTPEAALSLHTGTAATSRTHSQRPLIPWIRRTCRCEKHIYKHKSHSQRPCCYGDEITVMPDEAGITAWVKCEETNLNAHLLYTTVKKFSYIVFVSLKTFFVVVVFKCTKRTLTCKHKSHIHREGVMLMQKMV